MSNVVVIGQPRVSDYPHRKAQDRYDTFPSRRKDIEWIPVSAQGGSTHTTIWAGMLNMRRTHGATRGAYVHTDTVPDHWWCDTLFEVMDETGADIVFVPVSLKNFDFMSSTGILKKSSELAPARKLPFAEIESLPETFSADDVDPTGESLLMMSNGCWMADLTKPWAEEVDWACRCGIRKLPDGIFEPYFFSEDWYFSRELGLKGVKILGTNTIHVDHYEGGVPFPNKTPGFKRKPRLPRPQILTATPGDLMRRLAS